MQHWLSFHMIDGSSLDSLFEWLLCLNFLVVMLLFEILLSFSELGNTPHDNTYFNVLRIDSNALQH
jgi:hypothetical protein